MIKKNSQSYGNKIIKEVDEIVIEKIQKDKEELQEEIISLKESMFEQFKVLYVQKLKQQEILVKQQFEEELKNQINKIKKDMKEQFKNELSKKDKSKNKYKRKFEEIEEENNKLKEENGKLKKKGKRLKLKTDQKKKFKFPKKYKYLN